MNLNQRTVLNPRLYILDGTTEYPRVTPSNSLVLFSFELYAFDLHNGREGSTRSVRFSLENLISF